MRKQLREEKEKGNLWESGKRHSGKEQRSKGGGAKGVSILISRGRRTATSMKGVRWNRCKRGRKRGEGGVEKEKAERHYLDRKRSMGGAPPSGGCENKKKIRKGKAGAPREKIREGRKGREISPL